MGALDPSPNQKLTEISARMMRLILKNYQYIILQTES